jgi:S1-C subfamily serine protease
MPSASEWTIPPDLQPRPGDYAFDLDAALAAVMGVTATVPEDAFTADVLGTERAGNGVLIGEGLVATIGYLVTEASSVWLTLGDGRVVPGHVQAYDQATGFGLVQALGEIGVRPLPLGRSDALALGDKVVMAGAGGRRRSVAARLVARQEFAGYWEYLLDDALFTAPGHPHWGGAGLLNAEGQLVGIGSLQLEASGSEGGPEPINMVVPIELLTPILPDLLRFGRAQRPRRPWLGVYATEAEDELTVMGVSPRGPAARAGLKAGDVIVSVAGQPVEELAPFFRAVWGLGPAGVAVPLGIRRDGRTLAITITSGDRDEVLKKPRLH